MTRNSKPPLHASQSAPDPVALHLDRTRDAGEAILRVAARLERMLTDICTEYDVTPTEARLLKLAEVGPSQTELAEALGVDLPRVSTLARSLEQRGLLTRRRDRSDHRVRRAELTHAGAAVVTGVGTALVDRSPLPAALDSESLRILTAMLDRIETGLP